MGRDQSAEHRPWDFAAVTTRRLATLTMPKPIPAPHPRETILEDVLKPLDMSVNQLANNLGVTATRLNDIVRGRRGVTADTALRLPRRCLDVTRAEREFGFRATTPFDVGLRNTIEWYQSHRLSLQSGAS